MALAHLQQRSIARNHFSLRMAVVNGHEDIVEMLINHGA